MKFRLLTTLWVVALLASAVWTFGDAGVWLAVVVCFAWVIVGWQPRRSVFLLLLIACGILSVYSMASIYVPSTREAARRSHCLGRNVGTIALSLYDYAKRNGSLPPAYQVDSSDTPIHSWRTLLLDDLGEPTLAERYRFDEPWDGANNSLVTDAEVHSYCCPSDSYRKVNTTSYFAVVDSRTVWPGATGKRLDAITDNPGETILILEVLQKNTPWAKPVDLTFDQAVDLLTKSPLKASGTCHWESSELSSKPFAMINVGFANGSVRSLRLPLARDLAVALLTCDGGEDIDTDELNQYYPSAAIELWRMYALGLYAVISLLPVVRLRFRKT